MDSLLERFHTLDRLLGGDHAFISVDTSLDGVLLPEHLQTQASVVLQLSRLFVGGMNLDKEKVTANLKFAGRYHECVVPLAAIWGMHSPDGEEQYYWPEEMSVPLMKSLALQMFGGKRPLFQTDLPQTGAPLAHASADPEASEVPNPKEGPEGALKEEKTGKGSRRKAKRSHLSVVK